MKTPNQNEFRRLVDAYLEGTATDKQITTVEQYFDLFNDQPDLTDNMEELEMISVHDRMKNNIDAKINYRQKSKYLTPWNTISIAATIIFLSGIGIYLYQIQHRNKYVIEDGLKQADVRPGGNNAILTLSDGSKISLNKVNIGQVAAQKGVIITKRDDSGLVYNNSHLFKGEIPFNRIETPKGGQYQVTLPDGTKVWLNATSSLRYPVSFPGKERRVELSGEAYFEVIKDKTKTFKVITKDEIVEVVGTHFMISAYTDEPSIKTSLMEGIVKVGSRTSDLKKTLKPGQQAILNSRTQDLIVKYVDVDEVLAWKNGYFMFDQEPLESILRKISRWYDVDIDFSDANRWQDLTFSGTLSRYTDVSKVLNVLEKTEAVKFKLVGRTIFVVPVLSKTVR